MIPIERNQSSLLAFNSTIISDLTKVDGVCREAKKLLESNGQEEHIFKVDLLLREFLNNAIIHGNCLNARKHVKVSVRIGRAWIVLWIADEGVGFDWRAKIMSPPDDSATSGRGLAIGAQYAERMQFNRAGNQVTFWIVKADSRMKGEKGMATFKIVRKGGNVVVTLQAKLTANEVPKLQPALKKEIADGGRDIVFDFASTATLDSTGIGLLIAANNSLAPVQGAIQLINVSSDILKLLQSMRLVDRLHATAAGKEVPNG